MTIGAIFSCSAGFFGAGGGSSAGAGVSCLYVVPRGRIRPPLTIVVADGGDEEAGGRFCEVVSAADPEDSPLYPVSLSRVKPVRRIGVSGTGSAGARAGLAASGHTGAFPLPSVCMVSKESQTMMCCGKHDLLASLDLAA